MTDIAQRLRIGIEAGAIDLADIMDAADEIERLRDAIRRLAEQDATLSVCDGAVTVTLDATLTDAEREVIQWAANAMRPDCRATLRGLLERTK